MIAVWDSSLVNRLMDGKYRNGPNGVWLIHESFKLLRSSPTYEKLCKLIEMQVIKFVRENPAVDMVAALCSFLSEFKACIPNGDYTATPVVASWNEDDAIQKSIVKRFGGMDNHASISHVYAICF